MDLSTLPNDSPFPLAGGIIGALTLPISLTALYSVSRAPKDGANEVVYWLLVAAWSIRLTAHICLVLYSFLSPLCPVVYAHIYSPYMHVPCAANLLGAMYLVISPIGHFISTLAMLRRMRPILETSDKAFLKTYMRSAPLALFFWTMAYTGMGIWSIFEMIPTPFAGPQTPDTYLLSWSFVVGVLMYGVCSCISYVTAIAYVKKTITEVDAIIGNMHQGNVALWRTTLFLPQAKGSTAKSVTGSHTIKSISGAPGPLEIARTSHASFTDSRIADSTASLSRLKRWFTTGSLSSALKFDLATQERVEWTKVFIGSWCAIFHIVGGAATIFGAIPPVSTLPAVVQIPIANVVFKTYLTCELVILSSVKKALEINRKRKNTGGSSAAKSRASRI